MANLNEILMGLVEQGERWALKKQDPEYYDLLIRAAIKTAKEQIAQHERKRSEKLEAALDKIWTNPMTAELAKKIAGDALVEDDRLIKAALKELEATDE